MPELVPFPVLAMMPRWLRIEITTGSGPPGRNGAGVVAPGRQLDDPVGSLRQAFATQLRWDLAMWMPGHEHSQETTDDLLTR